MENAQSSITFEQRTCKICSEHTKGKHYGVYSCKSCKHFFQRSLIRKKPYICIFNKMCSIQFANRKSCKACRYNRCIEVGMSFKLIKRGRLKKVDKYVYQILKSQNTNVSKSSQMFEENQKTITDKTVSASVNNVRSTMGNSNHKQTLVLVLDQNLIALTSSEYESKLKILIDSIQVLHAHHNENIYNSINYTIQARSSEPKEAVSWKSFIFSTFKI